MNKLFKLKNTLLVLLFSLAISFTKSCGTTTFGLRADSLFLETQNSIFVYDLKRPDEKHFLPYVLAEISGLAHTGKSLLAVDDETGKIFEYDPRKKEIIHSIEFSKPGDFEGIEFVDNKIFVLESDGDIYSFDFSLSKKTNPQKIENKLSRENDTEGLGYDPYLNRLLIVCKENGEVDGNDAKGRSVYTYDLKTEKLSKNPFFSIRTKDLLKFWKTFKSHKYEESRIKFKPSAIAFHPIEETFYILSSVGKLLVVVNRDGSIKATYPLAPSVFGQPEGICFARNGDMYISSEGEGDRGYILKFSMRRK
ncbi:MAG: SdiA-regulated domain-containing protein [Cyclobacteriaceae bacterium]